MDRFKTKPGIRESIPINDEEFEKATHRKRPYVQKGSEGEDDKYFAVCPMYDNPIQIIGLYQTQEDAVHKPYGRHCRNYVVELARYDEIDYLRCLYSNSSYSHESLMRRPDDPKGNAFFLELRDNFDRFIYVLRKSLGIYISNGFAKELLQSWVANEGWRYYRVTYFNLPYSLLWAYPAVTMFGRLIRKDSSLHKGLIKDGKDFDFADVSDQYVKVTQKKDTFLNASFYIGSHKNKVVDGHLYRSVQLCVEESNKVVYKETIEIDSDYIQKLLNMKDWKLDGKLLDMAAELMK